MHGKKSTQRERERTIDLVLFRSFVRTRAAVAQTEVFYVYVRAKTTTRAHSTPALPLLMRVIMLRCRAVCVVVLCVHNALSCCVCTMQREVGGTRRAPAALRRTLTLHMLHRRWECPLPSPPQKKTYERFVCLFAAPVDGPCLSVGLSGACPLFYAWRRAVELGDVAAAAALPAGANATRARAITRAQRIDCSLKRTHTHTHTHAQHN